MSRNLLYDEYKKLLNLCKTSSLLDAFARRLVFSLFLMEVCFPNEDIDSRVSIKYVYICFLSLFPFPVVRISLPIIFTAVHPALAYI